MKTKKLKVLHYVNQFFGQEGQEDKADMQFIVKDGPVGPGIALERILGEKAHVVATLVCGDNYFAENLETAAEQALELIAPYKPDLFFAGPAFEAGRYGMSCGAVCKIVQESLGIPAITGMYEENPGVDLYRKDVYICKTERSASKMVENLNHMVSLALKLLSERPGPRLIVGDNIGRPSEDRYFSRSILRNELSERTAAQRGVNMLLAKLAGELFESEAEGPKIQDTQPPAPIKDVSSCDIALISDGGLTKKGNPDGFKGRGNTVWAAYPIEDFFPDDVSSTEYEIVHTGYYPVNVLDDPNRLVPVDVMSELEREGVIGSLYDIFYSTSGNATIQERCREMGEEIVVQLKDKGIDSAILTST